MAGPDGAVVADGRAVGDGADGVATCAGQVGLRGAAVIRQITQGQRGIDCRAGTAVGAGAIVRQIVAVVVECPKEPGAVVTGCVSGKNVPCQIGLAAGKIDATALGCGVRRDGVVREDQRADSIDCAARIGCRIVREGAVDHCHCRQSRIEDRAAVGCGIAGECAVDQREHTTIVDCATTGCGTAVLQGGLFDREIACGTDVEKLDAIATINGISGAFQRDCGCNLGQGAGQSDVRAKGDGVQGRAVVIRCRDAVV
ncbi:MAG: hypothetical protein R3C62_19840 [Chloroflexota bacterium]